MSKARELSELADVVTVDGGNVGIGTSSPLGNVTVANPAGVNAPTSVTAANAYLQLGSDEYGPSNNGKFMIGFGYTDATNTNSPAYIGFEEVSSSGDTYGDLTFYTRNVTTDTAPSERMRIDSSGNLLVGKTGFLNSQTGHILSTEASDGAVHRFTRANNTNTQSHVRFFNEGSGTQIGSITTSSGGTTAYNTSSDYRLKEDVQPMVNAIDRVKDLKPVNFAWKSDGSRVDGFIAHEAQVVVPEAVVGTKDAMRDEQYEETPAVLDGDGNVVTPAVMGTRSVPDYQGIDQSKLVPLLTAALQEALGKIDALEARVAALETP